MHASVLTHQTQHASTHAVLALPFHRAGKTTVAGIYGAVLRDLGLLSKGDVLVKVPADFIGDVLGASEKRTLAILEEARGRVLVIEEAYGLQSGKGMRDPFKVSRNKGGGSS